MKALTYTAFGLFLAGVVLFLAQMWFSLLSPDTFLKVGITLAALFVVVFVLNFLIKENRQTDKINEGTKLDG
jgi:hypothetical protein